MILKITISRYQQHGDDGNLQWIQGLRFKPRLGRLIFKGDKNPQHAFFRGGSKAVGHM
jgi:hypothetical protein